MKKAILAMLLALIVAMPAKALDLGDPAPALAIDSWVTGSPVDPTVVDGKTFYIVEVWSVTCPPCVQSIPIMNDIQKRYADQGLKIVSFTTDALDDVKPFLEQHPMEYASFIDKEGGSVISYMAADNRTTIPHAFIFDKSGALVWIGNPLDNLEMRVKQVLDGSLNAKQAQAVKKARNDLQAAFGGQNVEAMLDALKTLEGLEPDNSTYYIMHYQVLTELGAGNADDVKALYRQWYATAQNSPESLVHLSLFSLDQGHPGTRDPALALAAAKRAYQIGGATKLQAGLNLSEIYKGLGRLDLAMPILDDLVKTTAEPEQKELIQANLDFFKRLQQVSKNPDAAFKP